MRGAQTLRAITLPTKGEGTTMLGTVLGGNPMRLFAVLAAAVLLFTASAQAQQPRRAPAPVGISAFYGEWRGSGISESNISTNFRLTARDLDVTVKPDGEGFVISWTTVQRQSGDPNNPTAERKATTIRFVPSGRAGIWKEVDARDPLASDRYAWAAIHGQTLTVQSLAIRDDGGYDMQVYDRTLEPTGMKLDFTAFSDGSQRRTARGRLVKVAK